MPACVGDRADGRGELEHKPGGRPPSTSRDDRQAPGFRPGPRAVAWRASAPLPKAENLGRAEKSPNVCPTVRAIGPSQRFCPPTGALAVGRQPQGEEYQIEGGQGATTRSSGPLTRRTKGGLESW